MKISFAILLVIIGMAVAHPSLSRGGFRAAATPYRSVGIGSIYGGGMMGGGGYGGMMGGGMMGGGMMGGGMFGGHRGVGVPYGMQGGYRDMDFGFGDSMYSK